MAIYKRGKVYWYKFMWQGEVIRESTKQGNDKVARQMEAAASTILLPGITSNSDALPCRLGSSRLSSSSSS